MKIGRRLLALVLVLAMMLSNLPVGVIAAEIEELTAETTEALTETEQPIEEAPAETEAPETTEAATTEAVTEAAEETTEAVTEEVTEAATEEATEAATEETTEATEAPTEEATEAPTEEATEASTEEVTEATESFEVEEETASVEEANTDVSKAENMVFRYLAQNEDGLWYAYVSDTDSDETPGYLEHLYLLPGESAYVQVRWGEWRDTAWYYTTIDAEKLYTLDGDVTIEEIPDNECVGNWNHDGYTKITAAPGLESEATQIRFDLDYTNHEGVHTTNLNFGFECTIGKPPIALYESEDCGLDSVVRHLAVPVNAQECTFWLDSEWSAWGLRMVEGAEYVTENQESNTRFRYSLNQSALDAVKAGDELNLAFEAYSYNEWQEADMIWYLPLTVSLDKSPYLVEVKLGDEGYHQFYETEDTKTMDVLTPGEEALSVFYLYEFDEEQGCHVGSPVSADQLGSTNGILDFEAVPSEWILEGQVNAECFTRITSNTFNEESQVIATASDGTRVYGSTYYTHVYNIAFYSEAEVSDANFLPAYYIDPDAEEQVFYLNVSGNDSYSVAGAPGINDGTIEATDTAGLYKITLSDELVNKILRGEFRWLSYSVPVNYIQGNVIVDGGFEYGGIWILAKDEDIVHPDYLTCGWLWSDWDGEKNVYRENNDEDHNSTDFNIVPEDTFYHIYYLNTWNEEKECYEATPVPENELFCDDEHVFIDSLDEEEIKEGEANGACFARVSLTDWDLESEIYTTSEDGTRVEGVKVTSFLPEWAFYSSEETSYETYLREFLVDPDAEENAFYAILSSDYWSITEDDPWLHDSNFNSLMTLERISDKVVKVTLTAEGEKSALSGNEMWPGIFVKVTNPDGMVQVRDNGLCVKADEKDIIHENGFFFRWLNEDGEGWYDDYSGNSFGTNLYKGNEYYMYFFMNIWNEKQGRYVEVPVKPTCPSGITLRKLENVRDGEENGAYYYGVSVTKYNQEFTISTKYDGVTYTMPIYSYPHELALYSKASLEPSAYYSEPFFEVDPAEPCVFYLGANVDTRYWTVTKAYVLGEFDGLVDIEPVEGVTNFWKVTLNAEGINLLMSRYVLDGDLFIEMENKDDPDWVVTRETHFTYSRMDLEDYGLFHINGEPYEVLKGGYNHGYFTGEYDSDEDGYTWEVWENEFVTELPEGLSYDLSTNTLYMNNFDGNSMIFEFMPTDTLTIELAGSNSLITENGHAFLAGIGVNVVFTGDGSLDLRTTNDNDDENENARVWNTLEMVDGNLTIEGDTRVTVEIAGQGNEACWENDEYLGVRPGHMVAISMGHRNLYIKDNAYLETFIPEDADRNGADVGEDNAIWDERFPGGVRAIADASVFVSGGTLVTQGLEFDSGDYGDGSVWVNRYVQTGGDVTVEARGWNNVNYEDNGNEYGVEYIHTHYEGFTVRNSSSASVTGGTLTVSVEIPQARMNCSYYEAIAVRGGTLTIGGDAEITVEATNSESGNLLGVYSENGTGKLNITGGTLNVNGTKGEGNGRMGIYLDHETVFTMTGGTVNSEYADFMNHGPAHITGGTFNIGGLYWYESEDMKDDRGVPGAWVTGFQAGGPEFTIDGGTINIDGGHFVAFGMVAMNGGEINIINGSVQIPMVFALNDGVVNISNPGNEINEYEGKPAHIWPALWVTTYFSIGGSDIENAAPTLNISDHQIPTYPVLIDGTYHQMAGSSVNLTYGGTEEAGIYVATQFETDEEGENVLDEEGNPIVLSNGTFFMNDGVLNVINPGDSDAELSNAMQVDSCSYAEFRGGVTSFDTAELSWNGEIHIMENAVVDVKDAVILANAGHLVMDDGTLRASEESMVCLGMTEMNGGKMELDNAMILVNAGFHFNNGEIVINNTDETINPDAIFTSLAANTYFAIGNPEDPNSNPKLTINHNLTNPAIMVNGTYHQMAGSTVNITYAGTENPAIHVATQFDENDDPMYATDEDGNLRYDDEGNPIILKGTFLMNAGILNVMNPGDYDAELSNAMQVDPYSVAEFRGGVTSFNTAKLFWNGEIYIMENAVVDVKDTAIFANEGHLLMDDGILRASEESAVFLGTAEMNGGRMQLDSSLMELYGEFYFHDGEIKIHNKGNETEDISVALKVNNDFVIGNAGDPNSNPKLTINHNLPDDAVTVYGNMDLMSGTVTIDALRVGMYLRNSLNITGGSLNINVKGMQNDGILEAFGVYAEIAENPDAKLTISGGQHSITVPDGGQHDAACHAISAHDMPVEITGGALSLEGQIVFFGNSSDSEPNLILADDMVLYSLEDGRIHEITTADMGGKYCHMYDDDDVHGNWSTGEGFNFLSKAAIVSTKAGVNTTWAVTDGVLTFVSDQQTAHTGNYSVYSHAPWFWLSDIINKVEIGENLRNIGSHALAGLERVSEINFLGNAPSFGVNAFAGTTATAYYPAEAGGWTASVKKDYGGSIKWLPSMGGENAEVVAVSVSQDVLFSGEKATLAAELYPASKTAEVVWELRGGDEAFATLSVKNNVATVTAKAVTEAHVITVLGRAKTGKTQPMEATLTIYPKAQSVSIFREDEDVTGKKIKFDLNDVDLELSAALNPNDAEEYLASPVKWSSSSTKIATVDENGVVSFKKAGTVKITATANDGSKKKATVSITAVDMVQEIEIAANSVTELVGGSAATFTAYDVDSGSKLKSGVSWSVAPEFEPYASITSKGKLSTNAVQEAVTVTIVAAVADNEEVYDTIDVTIRPAASVLQLLDEEDMIVNGGTIYVNTDGYDDKENPPSINLSALAYPEDAFTNVTWKTSSKSVAVVNDGLVTGVWKKNAFKTGTVTITATDANSKKTASVKLVFGVPAEEVMITSDYEQITSGKKLTLTAEITQPEKPTSAGVTWKLKNAADKAYLTIDAKGKVTAKTVYAPTPVELVATSKDGCASAEMTLVVMPKDMNALLISDGETYVNKTTRTMDLNQQNSITLYAHNLDGENENVKWFASGAPLPESEDGSLTFTTDNTGKVTITAKHEDGRTASVTLNYVKLTEAVKINAPGETLAAGKTMSLSAKLTNAPSKKTAVTWSVEPAGLATITAKGKLTASASITHEQYVTVTATANDGSGVMDEVEILLQPQVRGIRILGDGIENAADELTNCTVVYNMAREGDNVLQVYAETFPVAAADAVTWKSSSTKVATINEDGEITCKKEGTVTITATAKDNSGKKASFKLQIVKLVENVTLNVTETVLAGGKSVTLKANTGDATNSSVTWSMEGDTAYATLSAKGVLKTSAVTAPKTVYITATAKDGSGCSATCTVTIYPATTSLQILYDGDAVSSKETFNLEEGKELILDATSLPISALGLYEWKISGSVAEVEEQEDGTVKITGVKASGKAVTLTCTALDGSGKKATVKIKVVPMAEA